MIFSQKRKDLRIKEVMTPSPITATLTTHLVTVKRSMNQHNIRHIPITDGGELVSVISERDVKQAESVFKGRPMEEITVSNLILKEAYSVGEDTLLSEVLKNLIKDKLGSVVVVNSIHKVTGIFTTHDACKLLLEKLR